MKKPNSLHVSAIVCEAEGGAHISRCVLEATVLACEEETTVKFEHNEKEYVISPREIVSLIINQHP